MQDPPLAVSSNFHLPAPEHEADLTTFGALTNWTTLTCCMLALSVASIACGSVNGSSLDSSACPDACDDGIACTEDTCTDNACSHAPQDDSCSNGYGCDPSAGCVPRYGLSQSRPGASCLDILNVLVTAVDATYWIDPDGGAPENSFEVYCDMTTAGGGWTLVYKYAGNDVHSQIELLSGAFSGPMATKAPLSTERADAIHQRAYDAFWTAKGRSWMSKWMLYDTSDHHEIDHNFAVFELDNNVAWNHLYVFDPTGCFALPGRVAIKVFDDATSNLVTVGSSTYRNAEPANAFGGGRGFLAADATQDYGGNMCGQPDGNYIAWPSGIKFDVTLNIDWAKPIAHMWYSREATDRNTDRCSWFCWGNQLTYSGREWYVR